MEVTIKETKMEIKMVSITQEIKMVMEMGTLMMDPIMVMRMEQQIQAKVTEMAQEIAILETIMVMGMVHHHYTHHRYHYDPPPKQISHQIFHLRYHKQICHKQICHKQIAQQRIIQVARHPSQSLAHSLQAVHPKHQHISLSL